MLVLTYGHSTVRGEDAMSFITLAPAANSCTAVYTASCSQCPRSSIVTHLGIENAISLSGNSNSTFLSISVMVSSVSSTQLTGMTVRPYFLLSSSARVMLSSDSGATQLSRMINGFWMASSS